MLWIHYCEFSNASVVVYPALLYRLPVAFSLIFLPPCGSFKCGSLWFIPGHFKENTQPNRKRKPEPQVGVFSPCKYVVCMGEGHLLKQMSSIQEERGVTHIPVICQATHLHIYSDVHTHTHTNNSTHTPLRALLFCHFVLIHTQWVQSKGRGREGVCVEAFEQSMAARKKMIKKKCKKMENPLNFVLPLYRQTSFVLRHHIACYLAPFPSFGAVLMPAHF